MHLKSIWQAGPKRHEQCILNSTVDNHVCAMHATGRVWSADDPRHTHASLLHWRRRHSLAFSALRAGSLPFWPSSSYLRGTLPATRFKQCSSRSASQMARHAAGAHFCNGHETNQVAAPLYPACSAWSSHGGEGQMTAELKAWWVKALVLL